MTFIYSHPYLPTFIVDAPDNLESARMAADYIRVMKSQLDMKVADLITYTVHEVNKGVYCINPERQEWSR